MLNVIITAVVGVAMFVGGLFTNAPNNHYDGPNPENRITLGATSFPQNLDSLTNPSGTDSVATVSHSGQHSNANDALEALEAKLGTGASTPVTDSILVGDGTGTSRYTTFATSTRFTATNFLANGSTTLQAFTFTTATGTSATTTNFFATTASSTNLFFTSATGGGITSAGNISATNGTGTFNNILANASTTLQNSTFINATGTSATTTNFFSTTASSTNVFSATGNITNLTVGSCTGCGAVNPAVTFIPKSAVRNTTATSSEAVSSNTTMHVGQVVIPLDITVNKITILSGDVINTNGTYDLTLYSEDGQTQAFSVTTGTISTTNTFVTTAVSSVSVSAGVYYIAINPNSTASANISFHATTQGNSNNLFKGWTTLASEPTMEGTVTITDSTPPATITPGSVTSNASNETLIFRLDN